MEDLLERSKDSGLSSLSFQESEDVSEHALIIGSKFEHVIKELDLGEKLNPLMKHVIYILERMDLMIKEKDELQIQLTNLEINLETELQQHQFERKENKAERMRTQNEFEQIEDTFRNENTELLNLISKLKDDNLKLRNLLNKEEHFQENEKQFKQNIDGIENCTQNLLIKEKRKVKNLQKEIDSKNEKCEQIEKQMEEEVKKTEILIKQLQKLKEENLILNQQIDFRYDECDQQLKLTNELKSMLTTMIKDHLDEQEMCCGLNNNRESIENSNNEHIERQKEHLNQLQTMQKLVETLFAAIEALGETIDTPKFDKIKFQQNLNDKLMRLECEQENQQKRLHSSVNTPIDSPNFCSLDSNCGLTKSPKHLNTEPPQSKFTLNEIRNILLERNSLQSQVKYLEKQLYSFKKFMEDKKDEICEKNVTNRSDMKDAFSTENFKQLAESSKKDKKLTIRTSIPEPDDFLPVQGPINKEPDEKLYPSLRSKSNSIFSKFFPILKPNSNK